MKTTRSLLDMLHCKPNQTDVWDESVSTSNYLHNRMYSTSGNMKDMKPFMAFRRTKVELSHLFVFWCKSYVHVPNLNRDGKLCDQSVPGILVGYRPGNLYRVLVSSENGLQVMVSKDVRFDDILKTCNN